MTPLPDKPALRLLAEGAVWLEDFHTLVVADVHLGKADAFRVRGLPVPEGDNARDLDRLSALCEKHAARQLVVAGDFFHSPSGMSAGLERMLGDFLTSLQTPVLLVIGNHDAGLVKLPSALQTCAVHEISGIRIIHDPADAVPGILNLAGHWHPVVRIPDGRRTSLRLPCFLLRGDLLVLPSFGSFTGGAVTDKLPGDRHFVTLRDQVIELPPDLTNPR